MLLISGKRFYETTKMPSQSHLRIFNSCGRNSLGFNLIAAATLLSCTQKGLKLNLALTLIHDVELGIRQGYFESHPKQFGY